MPNIFRNFFSHSNGNKKHPKKSFMNKPVFLGLLVLEIGKIVMHEQRGSKIMWKKNMYKKPGPGYMNTNSFIV